MSPSTNASLRTAMAIISGERKSAGEFAEENYLLQAELNLAHCLIVQLTTAAKDNANNAFMAKLKQLHTPEQMALDELGEMGQHDFWSNPARYLLRCDNEERAIILAALNSD